MIEKDFRPATLDELLNKSAPWARAFLSADVHGMSSVDVSDEPPTFHDLLQDREFVEKRYTKAARWIRGLLAKIGVDSDTIQGFHELVNFLVRTNTHYTPPTVHVSGTSEKRRYETARGLVLVGGVGRGKTYTAQKIAGCCPTTRFFSVSEMESAYMNSPLSEYQSEFQEVIDNPDRIVILDDLGSEYGASRYSNPFPIERVLIKRYELWLYHKTPTIITTNLPNSSAVAARYGEQVASRIQEMCDSVIFLGPDVRKRVPGI